MSIRAPSSGSMTTNGYTQGMIQILGNTQYIHTHTKETVYMTKDTRTGCYRFVGHELYRRYQGILERGFDCKIFFQRKPETNFNYIHISPQGSFTNLTRRCEVRRLCRNGRPHHITLTLPKFFDGIPGEENQIAKKSWKFIKKHLRKPLTLHLSIIYASPFSYQVHLDPNQEGLREIIDNVRFLRDYSGGHDADPSISF